MARLIERTLLEQCCFVPTRRRAETSSARPLPRLPSSPHQGNFVGFQPLTMLQNGASFSRAVESNGLIGTGVPAVRGARCRSAGRIRTVAVLRFTRGRNECGVNGQSIGMSREILGRSVIFPASPKKPLFSTRYEPFFLIFRKIRNERKPLLIQFIFQIFLKVSDEVDIFFCFKQIGIFNEDRNVQYIPKIVFIDIRAYKTRLAKTFFGFAGYDIFDFFQTRHLAFSTCAHWSSPFAQYDDPWRTACAKHRFGLSMARLIDSAFREHACPHSHARQKQDAIYGKTCSPTSLKPAPGQFPSTSRHSPCRIMEHRAGGCQHVFPHS